MDADHCDCERLIQHLREIIEVRFTHVGLLREADQEAVKVAIAQVVQTREADQKALQLAELNNREHFERLNKNAERTIEERGHFVAVEVFNAHKETTAAEIRTLRESRSEAQGRQLGIGAVLGIGVAAIGAAGVVAGIVTALTGS